MYVCICNGVTDKHIKKAVESGCSSLTDVRCKLDVANQCGKCAKQACQIIKEEVQQSPNLIASFAC